MPGTTAPIAAIVPTRNRVTALCRMVDALLRQDVLPAELIVVDASANDETRKLLVALDANATCRGCRIVWIKAERAGAAAQRNQGIACTAQPFVAFFDDDIVFEEHCLRRLHAALQADARLGGVNAMIVNQCYRAPGFVSRAVFRIMAGGPASSYAGRVVGPAINLLPEDSAILPEVVAVDWLNTTCTLYRREALPQPPFSVNFAGYSMMEDLALSLVVGRRWKLANVRTARVLHDSQPAADKADAAAMSRMELVNRHYVMTQVLGRRGLRDYLKLLVWEKFQLAVCLWQSRGGRRFWQMLWGKCLGFGDLLAGKGVR